MADELLAICDETQEGVIETDKLTKSGVPYTEVQRRDMLGHRQMRIDTRKWYLSKLAPKRYGDKIEIEHKGAGIDELLRAGRRRAGKADA